MAAKKTATKTRATKSTKSTAKTRPAATKKSAPAPKGRAKAPAKGRKTTAAKKVTKPQTKREAPQREMDETTGFAIGTDQQVIAEVLMEGVADRADAVERVSELIDGETRNGTPKPVQNLVSSVLNKLVARGFEVESSLRLIAPKGGAVIPSKPKKKAPAKKTSARKPAARKTAAKSKSTRARKK